MSREDLERDIDEYEKLDDKTYAQALGELLWRYDNEDREVYYEAQEFHNNDRFPDYTKVNL